MNTEQLNIEGKRSGEGFVAHKVTLVSALSRALSERVVLLDFTIGRKGFLTYLKSLGGSNVVKIVPSNGSASESQAADKRLKVVCGANTSYLENMAWVGEKTPSTFCEVRVSPSNAVKPNLGAIELSEALARVLPFTATEDSRPVLQCVLFQVKDGKLSLVSADGYRLAVVKLDFDGEEGEVLIHRDDLKGIASALRRARRARVSIEKGMESANGVDLVLDTELIRYKWHGVEGNFPTYENLIPTQFNATVSFDSNEALKAVGSLKALSADNSYPIDLTIGNGKVILSSPDDKGVAEVPADSQGEGKVRISGSYLADALRACGGMVDLNLTNATSPVLFSLDGCEIVVMPLFAGESPKAKAETKTAEPAAKAPSKPAEDTEPQAETVAASQAVAEAEEIAKHVVSLPNPGEKPKRKRSKAKEPVPVA